MELGKFYVNHNNQVYEISVHHDGYVGIGPTSMKSFLKYVWANFKLLLSPKKIEPSEDVKEGIIQSIEAIQETTDEHVDKVVNDFKELYFESKLKEKAHYIG
jgi:hypothetical protein